MVELEGEGANRKEERDVEERVDEEEDEDKTGEEEAGTL